MHPTAQQILKQYWGYDSFRPMQDEIIRGVLDNRDVLALLPTGAGKSVCFQVPAMMRKGLCLVISPLIALMKDQVENLRRKGITAFAVYAGMTRKEVTSILQVAGESNCKFLYVSPERLETHLFREYLPALDINLIAVDEAHCISQWGYDFRPSYLRIALLRAELPFVPVLALTASATQAVQLDICEKLEFKHSMIFQPSYERNNLSYSVFKVDEKINKIKEITEKVKGSSIVYCSTRKHTKEISDQLNRLGISADCYHAGISQEERNKKQAAWIKNRFRVMVCTNAFGMGIDKPDVRTVIHADVPDCLENYYQEAGRAGRDGKKSYAVLLYTDKALNELRLLPDLHFPDLDKIRLVYQALMNYLQIPSGSGEGNYYDFVLTDFIRKFRLEALLTLYALKALEQEEFLSYQEQIYLPSKINFTTHKQWLYDFERNHPRLEPAVKVLLRNFPGIFDHPVTIQEKNISFLLKKDVKEVVDDLKALHAHGIIQYSPRKDSPQLFVIRNRIKAEDLQIDQMAYQKRKKTYEQRIATMLDYIHVKIQCRSQFIANYFGDQKAGPCGICDNCLEHKAGFPYQ